ncbi:MAG: hypothetical protein U5K32_11260 [Bacteroidales bacterium]|nr:hypothetical protein [Bacteroidales bacterium]
MGRKFRDGYNLVVDERTGGRSFHKTNDPYRFIERTLCDNFISSDPSRPEIKQRMLDIADTLTIEDNPVMVLLKLKN